jgi:short-subunit dehydrogenase involved in D-alanine esterification of teichoic acids
MNKKCTLRRCLLLCLLALITCLARAANGEMLTINVSSGPVTIALAEHPVITFSENTLHITTAATTIDIAVSDISSINFLDPTGIKPVIIPDFKAENGELRFSKLPAGSNIEVFAINGMKLLTTVADRDGQATVSLDHLPKGAVIVKTAIQTIKITNKK